VANTPEAEAPTDVRTIADLPFHVLGRFPKPLLVGRCRGGQIEGWSNKEFFEQLRDLSLGFGALGVGAGDRVAILSESRPEWLLIDLAVLTAGGVTVPVYPTFTASQARYILQDCGAKVVVASTRLQLEKIQEIRHLLPTLESVVVMDDAAAAGGASVLGFATVVGRGHQRMVEQWGAGREFRDAARAIAPDRLATIIYTSGTTGEPKGVMLTHGNLVANMRAATIVLDVGHEDIALSFLPLSHSFERMASYVYLFAGVTMIFAESFDTVGRDIVAVRPTLITGVPRAYEKMQARVIEKGQAGSSGKAALFRWAVRAGMARSRATLRGRSVGPLTALKASIADSLVFSKIRAALGGRIRFVVSGSAPLAVDTAEFFQAVGLPVIEGYGLTETAPILTVNPPHAPRVGTVGKPIEGVEIRIAADGEILARGPNLMAGYYNKPEATAEAVRDGWFHTGDVGKIDAEGYLTITDRKKDLLVTSGGKKIAPQPIEAVLKRSPLVGEAILLGDRRKYAVALIVPDFRELERRLRDLGRPAGERSGASSDVRAQRSERGGVQGAPPPGLAREELVARPDVLALYQEIVDALNHDLAQFERIKKIALLPAEFTIESGELTPTMKIRRRAIEERWRQVIEALYAEER
jgi:long-chain acyl-CoA synthetase